jgi:hypothetical protein
MWKSVAQLSQSYEEHQTIQLLHEYRGKQTENRKS